MDQSIQEVLGLRLILTGPLTLLLPSCRFIIWQRRNLTCVPMRLILTGPRTLLLPSCRLIAIWQRRKG